MKCYIKYKLKRIYIIMAIMGCVSLFACAEIICKSTTMYEYEITGITFFIRNLVEVFRKKYMILIILSALLGLSAMDSCSSETEKAFPYKAGTRYAVSYLSGFLFQLALFLLISLSAVIHYISNYADYSEINMMSNNYTEICRLDSLGNGLMIIFNISMVCIAVYTLFGLFSLITKYRLLSIFSAAGIFLLPYYLMGIIYIGI